MMVLIIEGADVVRPALIGKWIRIGWNKLLPPGLPADKFIM